MTRTLYKYVVRDIRELFRVVRVSLEIMFSKLTTYLKDVRLELKKVNWPTRSQTTKYTLAVIAISLVFAIFFGALDFVFSWVLNNFIL